MTGQIECFVGGDLLHDLYWAVWTPSSPDESDYKDLGSKPDEGSFEQGFPAIGIWASGILTTNHLRLASVVTLEHSTQAVARLVFVKVQYAVRVGQINLNLGNCAFLVARRALEVYICVVAEYSVQNLGLAG